MKPTKIGQLCRMREEYQGYFKSGELVKVTGNPSIGKLLEFQSVSSGTIANMYPYRCEVVEESTKTLDELQEGDIVKDRHSEKLVMFVLKPGLYVMSSDTDHEVSDSTWSSKELERHGYGYKSPVQELTVSEISKRLGYEVKVTE